MSDERQTDSLYSMNTSVNSLNGIYATYLYTLYILHTHTYRI